MKIVISESQCRLLNEQPLLGLADVATSPEFGALSDAGGGLSVDTGSSYGCQKLNSSENKVSQLFKFAQKQPQVQVNQVGNWINRLKKGMEGMGANDDVLKVLTEIKTMSQLSTIINNWKKYCGNNQTLYQWLSEEHTITWDTIWKSFGKFKYKANVKECLDKGDYV
jgi:hypothetical protein